jgi:ankyrin repeat protein
MSSTTMSKELALSAFNGDLFKMVEEIGDTPLIGETINVLITLACINSHEKIVRHLIDTYGVENPGNSAIIQVCTSSDNAHLVKYLYCKGYKCDIQTALVRAAKYNRLCIAKYLLDKNYEETPENKRWVLYINKEALQEAVKNGHFEMLKLLLRSARMVDGWWYETRDPRYIIPKDIPSYDLLHLAVTNGHEIIVKYLLETPFCKDCENIVKRKESIETCLKLVEEYVNQNATTNDSDSD